MNNFTKRCVAAFASLAMAGTLCAASAVTVSGVAWGANTGKGVPQNPKGDKTGKAPWELGNKASSTTGSITIYKWEDEVEKGKQKKSTAVPGAEFTVKKATNIDLTKYSDWVKIANKISDFNEGKENPSGITFEGNGTTKNTSGTDQGTQEGVAKFESLKIGLYQVTESKVPDGFSAAESKTFYMTIPMIEEKDGKVVYNYNPSADPKNKNLEKIIKKEVSTEGAIGAGDEVKYTITSELTKMKGTEIGAKDLKAADFENYSIFDLAPADYFTTYENVVKKVTVGADDTNKSNTELKNEGSTKYYEVGAATAVPAVTSGKNKDVARKKIPITFTETGKAALAKAANDNAGKVVKVFVDLTFTLSDSAKIQSNTVENKAAFSSLSGKSQIVGVKTAKVEFVKFSIKKVSAKDTTKTLPGAKFKMFTDKTAAETCSKAITDGKKDTELTTACKDANTHFNEKTTAESTDSNAGTEKGVTPSYSVIKGKSFYILETEAPKGYIRNPDPVEVKEINADTELPFKDVPDDSNGSWLSLLPKTGAAGVVIFAVIGVCFVASGFLVYMRRRKKEEEQAKLRA